MARGGTGKSSRASVNLQTFRTWRPHLNQYHEAKPLCRGVSATFDSKFWYSEKYLSLKLAQSRQVGPISTQVHSFARGKLKMYEKESHRIFPLVITQWEKFAERKEQVSWNFVVKFRNVCCDCFPLFSHWVSTDQWKYMDMPQLNDFEHFWTPCVLMVLNSDP